MENVQKNQKTKKILSIVFNVIFYILILLLLIVAISSIRSKKNGGIPNVFGYGLFVVESSSMDGNEKDSFAKGDLIICKMATKKSRANIKIGDIVVFHDVMEDKNISHRVVNVTTNTSGDIVVITQGDKTALDHPLDKYVAGQSNTGYHIETVLLDDIKAIYVSCAKNGGNAIKTLQTPKGFGLFIVLPTAVLVLFEVVSLTRSIMAMNKEKLAKKYADENEAQKLALEEEKQRMREELLAELKKEQEEKDK